MEQKAIDIVFAGVDCFNRPVFCAAGRPRHFFCDTIHLFAYGVAEQDVLDYYAASPERLAGICYKGHTFNSEPDGDEVPVRIVSRKKWEANRKQNGSK